MHRNSCKLELKDLISGVVSSHSSSGTSISVWLKLANLYSWSIVSQSNTSTKTATSPVWKFYNAGDGIASYVPFSAELVSPLLGEVVGNYNRDDRLVC